MFSRAFRSNTVLGVVGAALVLGGLATVGAAARYLYLLDEAEATE